MSENKLTAKERKRFETLIEEGRNCYQAMAMIIREIHDDRLYREEHKSFGAFLKQCYGITKARGFQLIKHAEIVEEVEGKVSTMVDTFDLNERKTRELAKVKPGRRVEVLEAAVAAANEAGKPVTAAGIKKQAAIVVIESDEPDVCDSVEEYEDVEPDDTPEWQTNKPDVDGLRRQVNELTKAIKDAPELPGFEMVHQVGNRIRVDLLNIKSAIVGCVPYETCPYCHGHDSECDGCNGRGWVNKHDFNNAPKELQDEITSLSSGGSE